LLAAELRERRGRTVGVTTGRDIDREHL
jgi:hypothetical protein